MPDASLRLLVIFSADVPRAVQFYAAVGLSFVEERHGTGPVHFACELGDTVFEIYPAKETQQPSSIRLGFCVESVDETVDKLRQLGARVVAEPQDSPWGRRAVVCDPEGRRVELTARAHSNASRD